MSWITALFAAPSRGGAAMLISTRSSVTLWIPSRILLTPGLIRHLICRVPNGLVFDALASVTAMRADMVQAMDSINRAGKRCWIDWGGWSLKLLLREQSAAVRGGTRARGGAWRLVGRSLNKLKSSMCLVLQYIRWLLRRCNVQNHSTYFTCTVVQLAIASTTLTSIKLHR